MLLHWMAWGGAVLAAALSGACLRRWADAYAQRLAVGAEATAQTLGAALCDVRRRRFCLLEDILGAVFLAVCVAILLVRQGIPACPLAGLCIVLAALAWIDARSGLLPDALTLPLMVSGWLAGPLSLEAASSASALVWAGLAGAAGAYRWLRGQEGLGAGDVKYLAALAAWLGTASTLAVLWLACVLGGLAWCCLASVRRARACRFGPCLTLAALCVMLTGFQGLPMPVVS